MEVPLYLAVAPLPQSNEFPRIFARLAHGASVQDAPLRFLENVYIHKYYNSSNFGSFLLFLQIKLLASYSGLSLVHANKLVF